MLRLKRLFSIIVLALCIFTNNVHSTDWLHNLPDVSASAQNWYAIHVQPLSIVQQKEILNILKNLHIQATLDYLVRHLTTTGLARQHVIHTKITHQKEATEQIEDLCSLFEHLAELESQRKYINGYVDSTLQTLEANPEKYVIYTAIEQARTIMQTLVAYYFMSMYPTITQDLEQSLITFEQELFEQQIKELKNTYISSRKYLPNKNQQLSQESSASNNAISSTVESVSCTLEYSQVLMNQASRLVQQSNLLTRYLYAALQISAEILHVYYQTIENNLYSIQEK